MQYIPLERERHTMIELSIVIVTIVLYILVILPSKEEIERNL